MAKKYLWTHKEPITDVIAGTKGQLNNETYERINGDMTHFCNMLKWLRQAYTEKEIIAIMLNAGFERNVIKSYGFSGEDIMSVIEESEADEENNN